jgi:hypothetical protein
MVNNVTREVRRILNSLVQFGGWSGFQLKDSSAVMQVRDAADAGFSDAEVKQLLLHGPNASFKAIVTVPALTADVTVTLPELPGGSTGFSGMHVSKIVAFTQATGSPLTIDAAPPPGATLDQVRVAVDTAASGGAPTLSIGVSGTPALYMTTTDNNLREAGQYIVDPFTLLSGSPAAIIATLVPNSQTFTGRIELRYILA